MLFETERLYARELNAGDLPLFIEMQSSEAVMRYITGRPKTEEESIRELERIVHSYQSANREFLVMAVVKKEDHKWMGTCAAIHNDDGEHEIGYRLMEEYWGRGYGKEIVGGLAEFAFHSLNLEQIVAHVNKGNSASARILEQQNFDFIREYVESDTGDAVMYYQRSNQI